MKNARVRAKKVKFTVGRPKSVGHFLREEVPVLAQKLCAKTGVQELLQGGFVSSCPAGNMQAGSRRQGEKIVAGES